MSVIGSLVGVLCGVALRVMVWHVTGKAHLLVVLGVTKLNGVLFTVACVENNESVVWLKNGSNFSD